jgi:hypothetical protein
MVATACLINSFPITNREEGANEGTRIGVRSDPKAQKSEIGRKMGWDERIRETLTRRSWRKNCLLE